VLLSGGLDSSLIAAIAARETEKLSQAQYESRRKRLQEISSASSSPGSSVINLNEEGKLIVSLNIFLGPQ
jgi:asparagine synthase (glutamine-hydrolysing)